MKGEQCKLPIQDDHRLFVNKEKNAAFSGTKKVAIIAAFLLLLAMTLMTVFTFQSINGISDLKQEVENLKNSLNELQKHLDEFDNSRNYPENAVSSPKPEKNESGDDTNYNYDYDEFTSDYYGSDENYDNYDDSGNTATVSYDNIVTVSDDNILPLTGDQFTKDAKVTEPFSRLKRSIIGHGQGDSSGETKRRNMTHRKNLHHSTQPPTSSNGYPFYSEGETHGDLPQSTPTVRVIHSRRIHVTNDDSLNSIRRGVKASSLKSGDYHSTEDNPDVDFTVVPDDHHVYTRHRQRRLELDDGHVITGRMRPLPTAHFSGDTSKYVLGQHDNFNGNGHLRHPRLTYVDWAEPNWFHALRMDRHFSLTEGILTIKESGLYFVYAQIYYYDEHDINGFRVYRNENETLLQCTTMTHSAERVMKGNTCFTAGAVYFNENDKLSLGDLSESRYSLFEPGKSFFGVIKLGDVKIR